MLERDCSRDSISMVSACETTAPNVMYSNNESEAEITILKPNYTSRAEKRWSCIREILKKVIKKIQTTLFSNFFVSHRTRSFRSFFSLFHYMSILFSCSRFFFHLESNCVFCLNFSLCSSIYVIV